MSEIRMLKCDWCGVESRNDEENGEYYFFRKLDICIIDPLTYAKVLGKVDQPLCADICEACTSKIMKLRKE